MATLRNGTASLEREVKFEADSVQVESLAGDRLEDRAFVSVYYDFTNATNLLSAGVTLRRRTEHGRSVWQLKVPRADGRIELEEAGGPAELPDGLRHVLRAWLRDRIPSPVATLRTHRFGRVVDGARVTLDRVEVLDGGNVVDRFAEVEAELSSEADDDALPNLERRLRKLGARTTDGRSKLQRALKTLGEPENPKRSGRKDPALDRFRAYVQSQLDQILRHDPGLRIDSDADDVHEMRVAIRRLRAALRAAKPMLEPDWSESLRAELDWLAQLLAPLRDLDVFSERLEQEIDALDAGDPIPGAKLVAPLDKQRMAARDELLRALDSDRYLALLDQVEQAAHAPPTRQANIDLGKRARREFRKLKRQMRALGTNPSAGALHKARIHAKKARYATELAGDTRKRSKRFIKAAKAFQDTLGEHQDAVVAERKLRDLARTDGSRASALVAGRLIERQHERAARARAKLPKSWKRLK